MQRLANDSFLFTGQYFDSEIEEYYLRARQYNPHLTRFTSRDRVASDDSWLPASALNLSCNLR